MFNSERGNDELAMETPKKSPSSTRGLPPWTEKKQRAIARKGGESVTERKRSFRKILDWRLKLGGRADRCQSASVAFAQSRARLGGRPQGGHAHTPGRKKLAAKDEHPS